MFGKTFRQEIIEYLESIPIKQKISNELDYSIENSTAGTDYTYVSDFSQTNDNASHGDNDNLSDSDSDNVSGRDSDSDNVSGRDSDSDSDSDSDKTSDSNKETIKQPEFNDDKSEVNSTEDRKSVQSQQLSIDSKKYFDYSTDSDYLSSNDELSIKRLSKLNPSVIHPYTNDPFYHELNFEGKVDVNEQNTTFTLFMYIICNNTYVHPYMITILEFDDTGKFYRLPQLKYNNEYEHNQQHLRNQCFKLIFDMLDIQPSEVDFNATLLGDKSFKGGINSKSPTIGIDISHFIPYMNESKGYRTLSDFFIKNRKISIPRYFCISIDEIEKEKVLNISIDKNVKELFYKHKWMYEIKDEYSRLTTKPKILYAEDELSRNYYHSDTNGRAIIFKDDFDFSMIEDPFNIKRFVVFPSGSFKKDNTFYYFTFTYDRFIEL